VTSVQCKEGTVLAEHLINIIGHQVLLLAAIIGVGWGILIGFGFIKPPHDNERDGYGD
jgi:hypothetical protein